MSKILEQIVQKMKPELDAVKQAHPLAEMKRNAARAESPKDFVQRFKNRTGTHVIAELKKASPSKGVIREDFRYVEFAKELEKAGAAALSVLTERNYFQGSLEYLRNVRREVSIPLLRKDFLFDEYQIYEARAAGADAVLLIAAMLEEKTIHDFAAIAADLGMAVLGEAHTEPELEVLLRSPDISLTGINARDLRTFRTDLEQTYQLLHMIPSGRIAVAESAIRTRGEIEQLKSAGAGGFLIGETLMRAEHPGEKLKELIG